MSKEQKGKHKRHHKSKFICGGVPGSDGKLNTEANGVGTCGVRGYSKASMERHLAATGHVIRKVRSG